jgi:hypothetical protein
MANYTLFCTAQNLQASSDPGSFQGCLNPDSLQRFGLLVVAYFSAPVSHGDMVLPLEFFLICATVGVRCEAKGFMSWIA